MANTPDCGEPAFPLDEDEEFIEDVEMGIGDNEGYQGIVDFSGGILDVLEVVDPFLTMGKNAMSLANSLMNHMFHRIATESATIMKEKQNTRLTDEDVGAAIERIIPGQLLPHARLEGCKAILKFRKRQIEEKGHEEEGESEAEFTEESEEEFTN